MEYTDLIKYLKVCSQNIQTLHRHLRSDNFFKEHEILGEYYQKIDEYIDLVTELGMATGYSDATIKEAVEQYIVLDGKDYSRKEAFNYVYKAFNEIIDIIDAIIPDLKGYVVNKLEEIQYYLSIEANFKIARMFKAKID